MLYCFSSYIFMSQMNIYSSCRFRVHDNLKSNRRQSKARSNQRQLKTKETVERIRYKERVSQSKLRVSKLRVTKTCLQVATCKLLARQGRKLDSSYLKFSKFSLCVIDYLLRAAGSTYEHFQSLDRVFYVSLACKRIYIITRADLILPLPLSAKISTSFIFVCDRFYVLFMATRNSQ